MTVWMGTIPRENVSKKRLFKFFEYYDIHKWVVGRETGKNGYKHWQVRFQTEAFDDPKGETENFEKLKDWFRSGNFRQASDTWTYETKGGEYFTSEDNHEIILQRFASLWPNQQHVLERVYRTNDREIVVWYTEEGNCGKTWLRKALWERRIAHYVNPVKVSAEKIIQDCASEVITNGRRDIIVIDLPRTYRWTEDMYIAIECIKDGLVKDTRYSSRSVNMSGTKVLVLCNSPPKVGKLSADRWVILAGEWADDL